MRRSCWRKRGRGRVDGEKTGKINYGEGRKEGGVHVKTLLREKDLWHTRIFLCIQHKK